jgi:hypothetical protein
MGGITAQIAAVVPSSVWGFANSRPPSMRALGSIKGYSPGRFRVFPHVHAHNRLTKLAHVSGCCRLGRQPNDMH